MLITKKEKSNKKKEEGKEVFLIKRGRIRNEQKQ